MHDKKSFLGLTATGLHSLGCVGLGGGVGVLLGICLPRFVSSTLLAVVRQSDFFRENHQGSFGGCPNSLVQAPLALNAGFVADGTDLPDGLHSGTHFLRPHGGGARRGRGCRFSK